METSDRVTAILARITKMMDRSSGRLLKGVSQFENPDRVVEASPIPLSHHANGRSCNAQPDHDLLRRKPRELESDRFVRVTHDDSISEQPKSYGLERYLISLA